MQRERDASQAKRNKTRIRFVCKKNELNPYEGVQLRFMQVDNTEGRVLQCSYANNVGLNCKVLVNQKLVAKYEGKHAKNID